MPIRTHKAKRRGPPPNGSSVPPPGSTPKTAIANQDYLIPARLLRQPRRLPCGGIISRPQLSARNFWVLTRITDDSDPDWEERITFYGPPERLPFDLSQGVPDGWTLLKGEFARQFIKNMIADEMRYQRERAVQREG